MAGGVIFGQPEGSAGQTIAKATGEALGGGLNRLIEKKINDLQQRQGIDRRKETYAKAGLPDWLAELPEDKQDLFLKEFDFLPPQTKQQVIQALGDIGTEGIGQQQQPQQQQQEAQQPQQEAQQPNPMPFVHTQPVTREGKTFSPLVKPLEERIPALNSLAQAGEGYQREQGRDSGIQSFPELGRGTKGQPGPFESSQNEPLRGTSGFGLQRKAKGAGAGSPFAEEKQQLAREKHELALQSAREKQELAQKEYKSGLQSKIVKANKPYNDALEKKNAAATEILHKAEQMMELLQTGEVSSGWSGALLPARALGSESERFANLSDDVASALTSLQSGVQTISKIRFNQNRKPNLGQSREAQLIRTEDLIDDAANIFLEEDIKNWLIDQNNNEEPAHLSKEVNRIFGKAKIPPVLPGDEDGKKLKKNGITWEKQGPIYRFVGLSK